MLDIPWPASTAVLPQNTVLLPEKCCAPAPASPGTGPHTPETGEAAQGSLRALSSRSCPHKHIWGGAAPATLVPKLEEGTQEARMRPSADTRLKKGVLGLSVLGAAWQLHPGQQQPQQTSGDSGKHLLLASLPRRTDVRGWRKTKARLSSTPSKDSRAATPCREVFKEHKRGRRGKRRSACGTEVPCQGKILAARALSTPAGKAQRKLPAPLLRSPGGKRPPRHAPQPRQKRAQGRVKRRPGCRSPKVGLSHSVTVPVSL